MNEPNSSGWATEQAPTGPQFPGLEYPGGSEDARDQFRRRHVEAGIEGAARWVGRAHEFPAAGARREAQRLPWSRPFAQAMSMDKARYTKAAGSVSAKRAKRAKRAKIWRTFHIFPLETPKSLLCVGVDVRRLKLLR